METKFLNNPAALRALMDYFAADVAPPPAPANHKPCRMYSMMCEHPAKWFRDTTIDDRDRALLTLERASFVEYSKASYLRKIYHMKAGETFKQTEWTVEADVQCKNLVWSAGGQLHGFNFTAANPENWASVTVNVNVEGASGADFRWGYLSTRPANIRIFKGPPETCEEHPCDAMILRDCTPNTGSLYKLDYIASRRWDILVMKMCEDYDHPWIVVSVKDAGPYERNLNGQCGCQDHSTCGCVLPDVHI